MIRRLFYFTLLGPVALTVAGLLSAVSPKLRAAFRERRGLWRRLAQGAARRDETRPLVWFHVASAGEFLQAEPLLRRFRDAGWQLAVTVASVSGRRWLARVAGWPELIWADLLPWDLWGAAPRLYRRLAPRLVVYLQADLWPGLVWEATDRDIPQALVAARIAPGSAKLRRGVQGWYARDLYGCLDMILAATEADRARLAKLASPHSDLRLGGDPGLETVLNRVREAQNPVLPTEFTGQPVIVCGSTWPADEAHLLPALLAVLERFPATCVVLAPHEPEESHLRALEARLKSYGVMRLSDVSRAAAPTGRQPRVVLVDRVGVLARLYRAGRVAYVGGAFSTGVHNVAEPAAAGLPVLFGPRHGNSAAAVDLAAAGCGMPVAGAAEIEAALSGLLADPARCVTLGVQARSLIEARAGAAQAVFDALKTLVPEL
jgi:3-deoxy-D-manno-octulosonic-acid transferase